MPTAKEIADWIVRHSWNDLGAPLDPMSLEKLIYYAQCFHLVLHDRPLFPEEILAWQKGPVVPAVYTQYAVFGAAPIIPDEHEAPALPNELEQHLKEIVSFFGRYTAIRLSDASHLEQPWSDARDGVPRNATSGVVIPQITMKSYYRALIREGEAALSRQELLAVISEPRWSSLYLAGICARRMTAHPFYDVALAQKLSEPVPDAPALTEDFYAAPRERDFVEFEKGEDINEKIEKARRAH
jgi:uncharacterized phage-associated protein